MSSESTVNRFKMSEKDFTRDRALSFHSTLAFLLNFLRKSLAIEIDSFIKVLKKDKESVLVPDFTKSAFVKRRQKIKPEVFKFLSESLVEEFYTDNDGSVALWSEFRLLAVDGSRLKLPNTDELREKYGETKNQQGANGVQARLSVLYDVINGFVIDGSIAPLATGEKQLALDHMSFVKQGDLIIYDRGYPSFELIFKHFQKEADFLIRAKINFSNATQSFYDSGKQSAIVEITPGKNTSSKDKDYCRNDRLAVRMVRVDLPGGETEILITSLTDTAKYKSCAFKDLYRLRWGVETFYDKFKVKLKAEHFSGYSAHAILQDFYSSLFICNVQNLLVKEINDELAEEPTSTKYKYKVNTNISFGLMKDRVVTLFFSGKDMDAVIQELKGLIRKHLVPERPNRKFERDTRKYRIRAKPTVTKNMRDAL